MAEPNQNKNYQKTTRSARYSVKILFYCGIKSIAQLRKRFAYVQQNHCSEGIGKCRRNLSY